MQKAKKLVIFLIFAAFLVNGMIFYLIQRLNLKESNSNNIPAPAQSESGSLTLQPDEQKNMELTSPVFDNNQLIPSKYTCDGDNINPPLSISDVPENAKSLFLIVDDPDAPSGTWIHWLVFNINPKTSQIAENSVPPEAREGTTSFGKQGYGGPCPPSGTHHYYFKLYALDTLLNFDSSAKKQDLENAIQGYIIEQTELIGLYKR